MSEFRVIQRKDRKAEKSYSWMTHLHAVEKEKATFVSADALSINLLVDLEVSMKDGVLFEVSMPEYEKFANGIDIRWFAKVEKVCGYRVLAQYVASKETFWINFFSNAVHSLANASLNDPEGYQHIYAPPLDVNHEYKNDMVNFIENAIDCEVKGQIAVAQQYDVLKSSIDTPRVRVGQRLELLNYTKSTEIRVARVQKTCGRRINVLVLPEECPEAIEPDDDRQMRVGSSSQYWIDEASFFIFPVGWAAINNYTLNATEEYIEHTKKIAECINSGTTPIYHEDDVTFDQLPKEPVNPEFWAQVQVGQKFELIDPLAQQFNNMHVATVVKFCKTDGYLIVGMDGPDLEVDSFPIHIVNNFMFPVGYAEKNNLELAPPDSYSGKFEWKKYLKKENAKPVPIELFKQQASKERLAKFQTGMHLEAADMCENQFICPATIKSVHGRVINVNFDGWSSEFDELYDIDSHDILPAGWCELHDYTLQMPSKSN